MDRQLVRLSRLAQLDLGYAIEAATGKELWSIQHKIATAVSIPHSTVVVPSCNASGKSHLAGRIALAFYMAFTPGVPCEFCGGKCGGSKVITTSSKWEHLRDNLWGEIKLALRSMQEQSVPIPGRLVEGDLRLDDGPDHFIIGQSPEKAEGLQGYHSSHLLVIGDEATAIEDQVALGITRLMSSGDARQFLIFNPTTADNYAYRMAQAEDAAVIKITAYDTPHFTGERIPPGAQLVTQRFLDSLERAGMGPGSFEWETSVLANFWDQGEDTLIPAAWVTKCLSTRAVEGIRQLGIDLASYGDGENVIVAREGNTLVWVRSFPSMRQDQFWDQHVKKAVRDFAPHYLVYDADGVGAGVQGYAERMQPYMADGGEVLGFRGGLKSDHRYWNARSAWWWNLRRRFEDGRIFLASPLDEETRKQLSLLHYRWTEDGKARVESKDELRKRGGKSPDRADAVMYAYALSEHLLQPEESHKQEVVEHFGVSDHSEAAMWDRVISQKLGAQREENAVTGVSDWY